MMMMMTDDDDDNGDDKNKGTSCVCSLLRSCLSLSCLSLFLFVSFCLSLLFVFLLVEVASQLACLSSVVFLSVCLFLSVFLLVEVASQLACLSSVVFLSVCLFLSVFLLIAVYSHRSSIVASFPPRSKAPAQHSRAPWLSPRHLRETETTIETAIDRQEERKIDGAFDLFMFIYKKDTPN